MIKKINVFGTMLSKDEMRSITGGNVPRWCIARCCTTGEGGHGCDVPKNLTYAIATYTGMTCAEATTFCTNGGGYLMSCGCESGPYIP